MDLLASKILSLFLMGFLTLGAGLLPILLITQLTTSQRTSKRSKADFVVSLLNCFAGGVFLATTLLHLFPEVGEVMKQVLVDAEIFTSFPVAEFVISVGFFMIMLLEHLIMMLQHRHNERGIAASADASHDEKITATNVKTDANKYGSLSLSHSHHDHSTQTTTLPGGRLTASTSSIIMKSESQHEHSHDCQQTLLADIESREDHCVHIITPTHHQSHHRDTSKIQSLRALLLLLALSLHTVFEGLALGLQSTQQQVWTLFVAVAIHKAIIAFTMGIQFTTTFANKSQVVFFMVVFALMSPLGIAVGTAVTSTVQDDFAVDVASAVLQGIATGTFVYVTFFEVLQKEVGQDHSLVKVGMVILGYALVALINLFSPHE